MAIFSELKIADFLGICVVSLSGIISAPLHEKKFWQCQHIGNVPYRRIGILTKKKFKKKNARFKSLDSDSDSSKNLTDSGIEHHWRTASKAEILLPTFYGGISPYFPLGGLRCIFVGRSSMFVAP